MVNVERFFESGHAVRAAALWAGTGVALGAFGAHGLKAIWQQHPEALEVWKTAALYHLMHAVVMLVLALQGRRANRTAWSLMALGSLIFSGTLYVLAPTGWKFLGAITPFGGALLIAGWLALARRPWRAAD